MINELIWARMSEWTSERKLLYTRARWKNCFLFFYARKLHGGRINVSISSCWPFITTLRMHWATSTIAEENNRCSKKKLMTFLSLVIENISYISAHLRCRDFCAFSADRVGVCVCVESSRHHITLVPLCSGKITLTLIWHFASPSNKPLAARH